MRMLPRFRDLPAILCMSAGAMAVTPPPSAWVQRYNGPSDNQDLAKDVLVSSTGDLYVVGFADAPLGDGLFGPQMTLLKYTAAGSPQWTRTYAVPFTSTRGKLLAEAPDGDILAAGGEQFSDMVLIRYSPEGLVRWTRRFVSGNFALADPVGLSIDEQGDIVVLGPGMQDDVSGFALLKYAANGTLLWSRNVAPDGQASDPRALAVAPDGTIYVGGSALNETGFTDGAIWTYSPAGVAGWTERFSNPDRPIGYNNVTDLAISADGDLLVAGQVGANSLTPALITLRYDSTGAQEWSRISVEPAAGAPLIAEDQSGRVVMAAAVGEESTANAACYRMSESGALLSTTVISLQGRDSVADMVLDGSGAAYLVGTTAIATANESYLMTKVAADASIVWVQTYRGPLGANDAQAVALGSDRSVYVTGDSFGPATSNNDMVTLRLEQASFGDMNCDGLVGVGDIGAFVMALTDAAGYAAQLPGCEGMAGDLNEDGLITVSDIGPFVALLTAPR